MTSSDNSQPETSKLDYFHNENSFQADVLAAIQSTKSLDDTIRMLYAKGYGKLLICRGLNGRYDEDSVALKQRVVRVINELLAEQEKASKP